MDVGPAEQIVIIEDGSRCVVAADAVLERRAPGPHMVGSEPDLRERPGGWIECHALVLGQAIPGERAIPPAELFIVLPRFAIVDLAVRGLNGIEETSGYWTAGSLVVLQRPNSRTTIDWRQDQGLMCQ